MTISATITSSKSNNHHKSERTKRDCRAKPAYKAGKRAKRERTNGILLYFHVYYVTTIKVT
ncbi:hypothetical protein T03_2638 [Trichinella britovi]|uniref:Uncharacterized protein n=1 Tax=Trichinella britovi TaxID=45882 RepID=A0A0V1AMF0_TRIBR|nr:hypothetical protein T03_2638 [Trichinella britovi]